MEKCPECQEQFNNSLTMLAHARYVHKFDQETVYRKLHNIEDNPTCECDCGALVPYITFSVGYRKYVRGHASRVKNNFNTEKSMNNSIKKRREMLKDGTWKPWHEKETGKHWSKGKTKENCASVMQATVTRETPEYKLESANRMRENRLNGIMPTLYGKDASQWKGGTSSLTGTCYANTRLYKEWKLPILKAGNFQCSKCENKKDLHVHHDKIRFSEIIHLIAKQHDWEKVVCSVLTEETCSLKKTISDSVVDYHVNNKVSGIILCRACHGELHPSLNFKQNNVD